MKDNKTYQYSKVAEAIAYLENHFKEQPSLDAVANYVNLSSFHFQRLFKDWVGISPTQYLKYISSSYTKAVLKKGKSRLFATAVDVGFSGTSRLHDMFVTIEGMTPGEYKNGGSQLIINFSYAESPFGDIIVASTNKGVCHMAFVEDRKLGLSELRSIYPNATYNQKTDSFQKEALSMFSMDSSDLKQIKVHLKGTKFQIKVWEALLTIPSGMLTTYGEIAKAIDCPNAYRAVGTSIGKNPIAYVIPCHRVIQGSGNLGGYRWSPIRKKAIVAWEATKMRNV